MLTLGILLSYFWAAERYIYDVMPLLVMLGIIGFWQGYQLLSNKPVWRRIYTGIGIGLIAASILMSTLVALSVNYVRFDVIHLLSSTR
jgi:hypothetical protein